MRSRSGPQSDGEGRVRMHGVGGSEGLAASTDEFSRPSHGWDEFGPTIQLLDVPGNIHSCGSSGKASPDEQE
jgi:hypothetical protein